MTTTQHRARLRAAPRAPLVALLVPPVLRAPLVALLVPRVPRVVLPVPQAVPQVPRVVLPVLRAALPVPRVLRAVPRVLRVAPRVLQAVPRVVLPVLRVVPRVPRVALHQAAGAPPKSRHFAGFTQQGRLTYHLFIGSKAALLFSARSGQKMIAFPRVKAGVFDC